MSFNLYQEKIYQGGDGFKVAKNVFIPANERIQPSFDGTGSSAVWVETRPTHDVQMFLSNTGSFDFGVYQIPVASGAWYLQGIESYKFGNGAADAAIEVGVSGSAGLTPCYALNLSGTTDGQWLQPSLYSGSINAVAQTNKGDSFYITQAAPSGSCGAVVTLRFGLASIEPLLNP